MRNTESFFFLKKIQRLAHSENFVFTKLVFYKPLPLRKNQKTSFFDNSNFFDLNEIHLHTLTQCTLALKVQANKYAGLRRTQHHMPCFFLHNKKKIKKISKSYQSLQQYAPVNKIFPIFVLVFQKLIKKQKLYFHEFVPSFFIENVNNSFVFFKPLQNVKFLKFFCTFFSLIKTNSFFNKKQLTNLQIAFLKKQKKTQKFFFNLFFNMNRKYLNNFLGARKNFFLFEQKEQQKESFSHFLFILLFFNKQKKCLTRSFASLYVRNTPHIKPINDFSFSFKDFLLFEKSNYSKFFLQFFKEIQIFLFFILKDFKDFQTKKKSIPPKNLLSLKTSLRPMDQGFSKYTTNFFEHFQKKMFLNLTKTRIFQTTIKNLTKKAVFFQKKFIKKIYNLLFFSILNHNLFYNSSQIPNFCFFKQFTEQKKIYQKIQSKTLLEFAKKKIQILFEFFETQNFLKLCLYSFQNGANFQMILHQYLKIPFCTISAKIINEQNVSASRHYKQFVHAANQKSAHSLARTLTHSLAEQVRVQACSHSFFQSNMQTQKMFFDLFDKTNKNLYSMLCFLHFEKNLFHFFTLSKVKDFSRKKENLSSGSNQSFSFSKPLYKNSLAFLFLIFESNYSYFLFFNSTVLLFFKKFFPFLTYKKVLSRQKRLAPSQQIKNLLSTLATFLENFVLFKNLSILNLYLTNNFLSFHCAKTKKIPFTQSGMFWWIQNEPNVSGFESSYSSVFENQKQMQNLFIFQKIYWQFSKKFLFLQTQITKLPLFQFSPLFSCFLGLNYKNLSFFFLAPEKILLDSQQVLFFLNHKNKKEQDLKNILLKKKAILFFKDQVFLYEQKNFQHFVFENKKYRALNFDGFSVSLIVNYQKQLKNYYIFEKIPTRENIHLHLSECKQILKKSIGKKQIFFMKKLHKKILIWCKKYKDISKKEIFDYCDSMLLKFLWNWARKTHPNKSKIWIRKKYFHLIHSNKWFFGKKLGNNLVCLPLHSQITKSK